MQSKLILFILLLGCGTTHRAPAPVAHSHTEQLAAKVSLYEKLQDRDVNGFILTDSCDALFFSGLLGAARPDSVNIEAAAERTSEGIVWHRRPAKDCSPSLGTSRSTISRDMLLGLMWHMWRNKQLDLATELMEDLKSNSYFLRGEGTAGELLVNQNLLNTLANLIKALDGPRYGLELAYPTSITAGTGFESHLATWHILLRGEILGKLSDSEFDTLKELASREPQNPLYRAAAAKYIDGSYDSSVELLLNEQHWPASQLPSSANHCSSWPIQRDLLKDGKPNPDWLPCPDENKTHSGAELIVIYYLILGGT